MPGFKFRSIAACSRDPRNGGSATGRVRRSRQNGIDAVILTHAHLDHCGWIPRLVREGFHGPIYATSSTIDLCGIILPDSGHLQEEDANFYNRHKKSKHNPALPLYTLAEAEASLQYFRPVEFEEPVQLSPELSFRFVPAAHILGSSMVELKLNLDGQAKRLLFTGDIGRARQEPSTRKSCSLRTYGRGDG